MIFTICSLKGLRVVTGGGKIIAQLLGWSIGTLYWKVMYNLNILEELSLLLGGLGNG